MNHRTKAAAVAFFAVFAWSLPLLAPRFSRAVEVSLEENRAERGNIGYVDLQLLFRLYPDTQKAKQNFEEVVRQAEEQVNLRKAEILGLRAELARLRVERDFAVKNSANQSAAATNYVAAAPPPAPSAPAAVSVPPAVSSPTASLSSSSSSVSAADSMSHSTAAASVSNAVPTAAVAISSPAPAAEPAPLLINLPGLTPDSAAPAAPAGNASASSNAVAQVDGKIQETTKNLNAKEAEFKTYQAQVEKNLLDLESRRTEILLGKIYGAVREVAHDEGVSVVVDKSQILFGHKAVDLTDKVLEKLKSQPSQQ